MLLEYIIDCFLISSYFNELDFIFLLQLLWHTLHSIQHLPDEPHKPDDSNLLIVLALDNIMIQIVWDLGHWE